MPTLHQTIQLAPVVVKQLIDGPEAAERYAREVTALRLASRVDPPAVPTLLGIGTCSAEPQASSSVDQSVMR